ncbi:DUF2971 domain-containing protein [Synechocystis sp. FACHB-383]|uniref:DUF2971 domain-containing protein n=1 Tax=Synechocystis sp. FACHB-383 TaxID=2692864 RepID=UPI001683850C|nr:DUF2971 domain-containing protein [Synechocystis sp. FACHB-383]MBD2652860.1 DUF2971 domain-containing protein [Synechocystis sp. FACHB-383]
MIIKQFIKSPIKQTIDYDSLSFFLKHNFLIEGLQKNVLNNHAIVYQYVSATTLEKIIQTNQLQATNLSFMNDSKEFKHGLDIFGYRLKAYKDDLDAPQVPVIKLEQRQICKLIIDKLIEFLENYKQKASNNYARCFSTDGDLLSQWRAYGDYAIGLNLQKLFDMITSGFVQESEFIISKVVYNEIEQIKVVEELISTILRYAEEQFNVDVIDEGINYLMDLISTNINDIVGIFKDIAFEEEKEIRLLFKNPPQKSLRFRESGKIITPFIELNKENIRLPIDRIVVSPVIKSHFERIEIGLSLLLENNGHDITKIKIEPSRIPYRS